MSGALNIQHPTFKVQHPTMPTDQEAFYTKAAKAQKPIRKS
jgi:hypothetical protein